MTCSREDNPADRGVREGRAQGPNEGSRETAPPISLTMALLKALFGLAGFLIGLAGILIGIPVLYLAGLKSEWGWYIQYVPLIGVVSLPIMVASHMYIHGYRETVRCPRCGAPASCRDTRRGTQEAP